jgi:hypothetical protein
MFNVGDIVRIDFQRYTVVEINEDNKVAVTPIGATSTHRWHSQDMFTLDVPVVPRPAVLTGMTQFFKDMKEKQQHETSI